MTTADKIIAYIDGQAIPEPTECFAVPGENSIIALTDTKGATRS